ncbi:MAG: Transcriptional regulator, partial [uncultured Nocardioidaceae bacterium]
GPAEPHRRAARPGPSAGHVLGPRGQAHPDSDQDAQAARRARPPRPGVRAGPDVPGDRGEPNPAALPRRLRRATPLSGRRGFPDPGGQRVLAVRRDGPGV